MGTSEMVSFLIADFAILLVWFIVYMVSRSRGASKLGAVFFPFACFVSIAIILLALEFGYFSYIISRLILMPVHLMMQHGRFISLYVLLPFCLTGLIFWANRKKWKSNIVNFIAILPILIASVFIFREQYRGIEFYEKAYTQVIGLEKTDDVKIVLRTQIERDDKYKIIRMRLHMRDEMYMVLNKQVEDLYPSFAGDVKRIGVDELEIIPQQVAKLYMGKREDDYVKVYFLHDLETVCIEIERPLGE